MALFNSHAKGSCLIAENPEERYGAENIDADNPQEIKRLMLLIVKNIVDSSSRLITEVEDKDFEEKKRLTRKAALSVLRQMGLNGSTQLKVRLIDEVERYLWGYYVLDELVNDPDISDIRVLSWNYVRYKKHGKRHTSSKCFLDENDYVQFINLLAVRNKKSLSDVNAITYFTDTANEKFILRFNICTSFVSSNRVPVLTIRKIPKEKYTLEGLMEKNMLDGRMAAYLVDKAKHASGILFTGKGASGKTTLLNTLLEYIDEEESGVVIQESDELFISMQADESGNPVPSRDIAFLHTVSYGGEGKIEYSMQELTRNGLRMDLDYFIIGEIKGNEAEGFSMASYTGHKCWATVHGMSSFEGINKLADYIKQATGYEFDDCLRKLIGMEVVIFMKEFQVCEITEIHGYDEKKRELVKKVVFQDGRWL